MATQPGSYSGSAPSAPPASYQQQQSWHQPPLSYSGVSPSLSYSSSIRNQTPYASSPSASGGDSQFLNNNYSQAPISSSVYGQSPQYYGQPPSAMYGQPPSSQYGKPTAAQYGPPSQYGSQYPQFPGADSYSSYPPPSGSYGQYNHGRPKAQFPPGSDPEAIRAFEMGDTDGNGSIDTVELGRVVSSTLPFSMRTVNLMVHIYSTSSANRIGPAEFMKLWNALKDWKVVFERFDRDRSGKIDKQELREALLSMGYAISPTLLQILISKYDRSGRAKGLDYDNFIECGLVVKGLTDSFKSKDVQFIGSATLNYETFMQMVLPFIVA